MEKDTIYKKIGLLRNKIDAIKKSNKNPFFKSKYADINTIEKIVEPIEFEVGLTHTITSSVCDNGDQHLTLIIADTETKETLSSTLQLILTKKDMQQLISAHTYGRRGLLTSFYSLETEDDDGNSISHKANSTQDAPKFAKPQKPIQNTNKKESSTEVKREQFRVSQENLTNMISKAISTGLMPDDIRRSFESLGYVLPEKITKTLSLGDIRPLINGGDFDTIYSEITKGKS